MQVVIKGIRNTGMDHLGKSQSYLVSIDAILSWFK